jgi:hypothetical protein
MSCHMDKESRAVSISHFIRGADAMLELLWPVIEAAEVLESVQRGWTEADALRAALTQLKGRVE